MGETKKNKKRKPKANSLKKGALKQEWLQQSFKNNAKTITSILRKRLTSLAPHPGLKPAQRLARSEAGNGTVIEVALSRKFNTYTRKLEAHLKTAPMRRGLERHITLLERRTLRA